MFIEKLLYDKKTDTIILLKLYSQNYNAVWIFEHENEEYFTFDLATAGAVIDQYEQIGDL